MDINTRSKSKEATKGIVGSPKKGGAGGKGAWGKGGIDDLVTAKVHSKDPNYDSAEEEDADQTVLQDIPIALPELPSERILRDFFIEADNAEVARRIKELDVPPIDFVRKAVYLAMENQPYERELVSKLLSYLYGDSITSEQFADGFQTALDKLDDAILDIPLADEMLGKFIARAIVDEIVPPAFLKTCFSDSTHATAAVSLAARLVNDPHRSRMLEHIWGPGDLLSVKRLKEEVHKIIAEFIVTGDKHEADQCVRKLNAPSFHFQFVRYALRAIIDAKTAAERKNILDLLSFFTNEGLFSSDHVSRGFKQFSDQMDDVILDVPTAKVMFEDIVKSAQDAGWLSVDYK